MEYSLKIENIYLQIINFLAMVDDTDQSRKLVFHDQNYD